MDHMATLSWKLGHNLLQLALFYLIVMTFFMYKKKTLCPTIHFPTRHFHQHWKFYQIIDLNRWHIQQCITMNSHCGSLFWNNGKLWHRQSQKTSLVPTLNVHNCHCYVVLKRTQFNLKLSLANKLHLQALISMCF